MVKRLVLSRETTDEAVGTLVPRFPAVVSLEMKSGGWGVLTDEELRAVSNCTALTSLNLSWCHMVTAAGGQALRRTTAAPSLHILRCDKHRRMVALPSAVLDSISLSLCRRCNATYRPAH
jgi:hypothetical protein